MLHYEDFEKNVMELTGREYVLWRHILPAVPMAHRYRYIKALNRGFTMPLSFDYVMCSQTIKDDEYDVFLQQALISKINQTNQPSLFTDALLIGTS